MLTGRLQQDLFSTLRLEVRVPPSGVRYHSCSVSSRAKGQVGVRVGIWRIWGEVGRGSEIGQAG